MRKPGPHCGPRADAMQIPDVRSIGKTGATMTDRNDPRRQAGNVSRRGFLKRVAATASTAALFNSIDMAFPGGVHIAQAAGPEVKKATLGFIALTDAAPLF